MIMAKAKGKTLAWILAARPKTLVAAILPVGVSWLFAKRMFALGEIELRSELFISALLAAIFLQIATNFWNDYFDDIKGSDTKARLGPRRLLQEKIATRKEVRGAAIIFNL